MPRKKLGAQEKAALARMKAERDFPTNTCGASRHAARLADELLRGKVPWMIGEEPEHCGLSIATVVAELWRLRTILAQAEELPPPE